MKRIKGKSIISVGMDAFKIMNFYNEGKNAGEIRLLMKLTYQQLQSNRKDLIDNGWIIPSELGKCKLTEAGKYFLKTIYLNPQIRSRLK